MNWRNVVILFFLGIFAAYAQDFFTEDEKKAINEVLRNYPINTQLSIAFIENGQTYSYGFTHLENGLVEVDNKQKIFEIGSISKVFTATLLANAVLENLVSLNSQINDHLDFSINNEYKFTFKQLANHTSGLPRMPGNFIFYSHDSQNPYKDYDEDALKEFLEEYITLLNYDKKEYEYSNLGVGLLGYVLTRIYSLSYHELLNSKVFKKIGMNNSFGYIPKEHDNLIEGRNEIGEITPNWDLNILEGAGGILSNAVDMGKFIKAQFEPLNKALELSRQETHIIDQNSAIALGWHIKHKIAEEPIFWHNGGTGGFRSCMAINPDKKHGVIVLSNVSAFHKESSKIDDLAFEILKTLN